MLPNFVCESIVCVKAVLLNSKCTFWPPNKLPYYIGKSGINIDFCCVVFVHEKCTTRNQKDVRVFFYTGTQGVAGGLSQNRAKIDIVYIHT